MSVLTELGSVCTTQIEPTAQVQIEVPVFPRDHDQNYALQSRAEISVTQGASMGKTKNRALRSRLMYLLARIGFSFAVTLNPAP